MVNSLLALGRVFDSTCTLFRHEPDPISKFMTPLFKSASFSLLLLASGCSTWPAEKELSEALEHSLRSVSGGWHGRSFGENPIFLEFRLDEHRNGKVAGTGAMTESRTGATLPVTVSGTFRRPMLALAFVGFGPEGERVQARLEGEYTTVGGISTTLQLSRPGSTVGVAFLMQER